MSVGKNILYSSIGNLITPVFTAIFWIITANMSGSDAIGIASTVASITLIVVTLVILDINLGMKRSLGIAISKGNYTEYKQILTFSIFFVTAAVTVACIVISIPELKVMELIGISHQYTLILLAMIAALAFNSLFTEALISAHQSKKLLMPLLIGSIIRFPLLLLLLYFYPSSAEAVTLSYSAFLFVSTFFYALYISKLLQGKGPLVISNFGRYIRLTLSSGIASWAPHVISVLGSQLAIVTVFSLTGPSEAGKFYLSMTIFTFALFIVTGINRVSHPLIAGMPTDKQQIDFVSYTTKIAFIFTMPVATIILLFGTDLLGLIGNSYKSAYSTLAIFMIGVPFTIFTEIIYYFIYGRGEKRTLLYLGMIGNLPRIVLYFILVPILGLEGAAMSYLIGSVLQLILSLKVVVNHRLYLKYVDYFIFTAIPLLLGGILWYLNVPYYLSLFIIFLGPFLIYVRLKLFTESDVHNIIYTALPESLAAKIYIPLSKVVRKLT